jgi:hypothetical protein
MKILDVFSRRVYTKDGEQKAVSFRAGAIKVTDRGNMYLRLFHIPDVDFYIRERIPEIPAVDIDS